MSQYTDLSKVGQVSAMVIRVEGELEECVKQARLFNAREVCVHTCMQYYAVIRTLVCRHTEVYCM
jgi:hypothetical protein